MAIKDSIAKLRKALRTTQTNAPAVIDTLIRGLDGVAEAAEEESTYSTDERVVGKWIDGSDIYEKVIELASDTAISYTGWTDTTIDTTTIKTVLSAIGVHSDGTSFGTLLADPTRTNHTVLGLSTGRNTSSATIRIIILRYTKLTASRSPEENDTKNDGDKEKNER